MNEISAQGEGRLPENSAGPAPVANRHKPPSTIYTVQALRGVAALLVVLQHLCSMWYPEFVHSPALISFNGTTGVDLFFVISGFIMPLSIRRSGSSAENARAFMLRRIERIVPLYWICTLIKYLTLRTNPALSKQGLGSTWHVISSFFFLPSFNGDHAVGPLLQPAWTLIWEMLFYVLIAVALLLAVPLRWFLPPVLIGIASLHFVHVPANIPLDVATVPLVVEFLLGLALSLRFWYLRKTGHPMSAFWAAFIGVAAFYMLVFYPPATAQPLFFGGPLAMLVVGAALELESRIGARIPRVILLIGDASYSLYLTHWFLVSVFRKYMGHSWLGTLKNGTLPLLLMTVISCVVGVLVYRFVESPINQFFRVRRRTAVQA